MTQNKKFQALQCWILDILFLGMKASPVGLDVLYGGLGINTANCKVFGL
jgi:hypothetical protein